jgi:hypothetical protein
MSMIRTYNEEQIRKAAPSVYSVAPSPKVSAKYQMFDTAAVIPVMDSLGWKVVSARQSITRLPDNTAFAKHLLEFGHRDFSLKEREVGDLQMRIGMTNSHDAKNAVGLFGRMLRTWCANQATVEEAMFGSGSFRHTLDMKQVSDSVYEFVRNIPPLNDKIDYYRAINLSHEDRLNFAHDALAIRWDEEAAPVKHTDLLMPRRQADNLESLWNVYQVVQENLTKGGIAYQPEGGRKNKTRNITSIDSDLKVNGKLWALMTAYAAAKR